LERSGLGGRFLPGILIFRTRLLSTVQLENRIDADLVSRPRYFTLSLSQNRA
jgi:hypothetical protein